MQALSIYRSVFVSLVACAALAIYSSAALAITPDDPGSAAIQFTLNSGENVKSISPYIYGSNSTSIVNRTFDRSGGNRWTGYNWETNASQAGRDWYYQNDTHMGTGPAGNAVLGPLTSADNNDRGIVVTVPTAGYVAGDTAGPVQWADRAPSPRFKQVVAKKPSALSLIPDAGDGFVYTDEFVNWVETQKNNLGGGPVFYSLDNEPGLWGEPLPSDWQPGVPPPCPPCNPNQGVDPSPQGRTHGVLHPFAPTFQELLDKTVAHATAIKSVNPNAKVFGGVGYGWNDFVSLQGAPDANQHLSPTHPGGDQSGEMHFYEYLLDEVRKADQQHFTPAELAEGKTLMDVLDLHWYPEAQGGGVRITENNNSAAVVAARVQAPRSLWDPTYTETSWISQWGTWVGSPGTPGPIRLLPRVQRDVNDFKPGTQIAITEYNYGGGNHISGAIAQADVLGIFGRENVFAAALWELDGGTSYINAAFNLYRNYDGDGIDENGGQFGDTSIDADTSSLDDSAVHASIDSTNPNRMVVVAINRTSNALTTGIAVTHDRIFDHAKVYRVAGASSSIMAQPDIELDLVNAFQYTMPAFSVTTLVLISDGIVGDFNRDGTVDAADYVVWRDLAGQQGNLAADANEDNLVDGEDYALWKANFGQTELGGGAFTNVPEPSALALALFAACVVTSSRNRHSRRQ